MIDHNSLKATFWLLLLVITWLLTYFSEPFFFVSVHWNLFRFNQPQPQPLRKQLDEYFPFFSRSGTTFENTVRESSPQNGSTRGLNLMLIVIVLLAIFILAIAVVFGISFFRRHQCHKNQGKFLVSFAYILIFYLFIFLKYDEPMKYRSTKWKSFLCFYYSTLTRCKAFSFLTRLVLPLNGRTSLVNECNEDASVHTHYTPSPHQKKKQKKDFSFQKWHNRMCHCLAFHRFVRFS